MNNKSLYMLCSLLAMILLLFESRDVRFLEIFGRVFLCGGALYYVLNQYQRKKSVSVMMALMVAVGIIYNPIVPPHFPNVGWVVAHVASMTLFYLIALRTPVGERMGQQPTKEEEEPR